MKSIFFLLLAIMFLISNPDLAPSQITKVPSEVWQKLQKNGVVPIGIKLKGQFNLGKQLSPAEEEAQTEAIRAVKLRLAAELQKIGRQVRNLSEDLPFVAMDANGDVLLLLEKSPNVESVGLDGELRTQLSKSVPMIVDRDQIDLELR